MNHDHGQDNDSSNSIGKFVFIGFLLVAGFFLITGHRAHLFGILPFLLLAACPLMHFFGHRHHRHGGGNKDSGKNSSGKNSEPGHGPQH